MIKYLCIAIVFTIIFVAGDPEHVNAAHPKVMIIGIDAATWKVMNPLIDKGELPNIKKLMDKGVYGTIVTLNGPPSPVIWTSVATGKIPEKHKIEDFMFYDMQTGDTILGKSYMRKAKALWNIVSENDKKAGIVNWWMTYPAERISGYIVANTYRPWDNKKDPALFYPTGLELPELSWIDTGTGNNGGFVKEYNIYKHELKKDRVLSEYLEGRHEVDLFMAYTLALDWLQHEFWRFMEPGAYLNDPYRPDEELLEKYGDAIQGMYRDIDSWIGELIKDAGEDTTVMVLSDHGMKGIRKFYAELDVNAMLKYFGLAEHSIVLRKNYTTHYIKNKADSRKIMELFSSMCTEQDLPIFDVSASDKEGFDVKLVQNETGFFNIHIRSKKYSVKENGFCRDHVIKRSGDHDLDDGIFIMAGNNIIKGGKAAGVSVLDIAPTALYLLGLPAGRDMDGKVATSLIDEKYLNAHPVKYINSYEDGAKKDEPSNKYMNTGEEELKNRLRSLGYIQ